MSWYLFLLLPLFPWFMAWVEATKDAKRSDRWNHLMKENFHRKWGYLRGWLLLLPTPFLYPYRWLMVSYAVYAICAFGFGFTYWLNMRRGKDPWYQSREPMAAKTDKAFVAIAARLRTTPEQLAYMVYSTLLFISTSAFAWAVFNY